MADRLFKRLKGLNNEEIRISGSFRPNGTSAPTDVVGKGYSVARSGVGLYTVTLEDKYNELLSARCSIRGADGVGHKVEIGDYSAANKTLQIRAFDGRCAQSYPLDITALREIASDDIQNLAAHGGLLASNSTPILARVNGATDKALRVTWAASDSNEVQFPPIPMLPGMNGANAIVVHLLMAKNTNTDNTVTVDVQAYDGVGDTEMGAATAALGAAALAEYTATIAAANLGGHPTGFLNLSLVPGAHTTDAIYLYAAWLESLTLVDLTADADNEIGFDLAFRNSAVA